MSFQCAEWVFANGLPPFVVMRILFDVIIIDIYAVLVFTALNNAFGKFGTLLF